MIILILFLLLILAIGYVLIVNFIGPSMILKPKRKNLSNDEKISPTDLGLNYEDVEVKSFDGEILKGWLVKSTVEPVGNVIYIHGTYRDKTFGLGRAKFLSEAGYNVLLVDLRFHGESGGKYCTYGYLEKFDISEWINFLSKRFPDLPIALFGISLGGAIAIQTAGIDNRVCAVIAEGSFSNFFDLIYEYQKLKWGFTSKFLTHKIMKRVERIAGFKVEDVSPIEYVRRLSCPVLYIHGKNDKTVKPWHSEVLYKNSFKGDLLLVDGAGHLNSWERLGDKQVEVLRFLKSNCSKIN
jgi:hypothetical protein